MFPTLEKTLERYRELEGQMADPAMIADRHRYTQVAKEHAKLSKQVKLYLDYKKVVSDITQTEALLAASDEDMRQLAEEELAGLREQKATLESKIEEMLLIDPNEDFDKVIVEIRAGTGGDEAALFAGDLYNMYSHYARDHGFRIEDISFSHGEAGGFKEIVFGISGEGVFRDFRYESGGHRVQRVPKTETQGRIHTSAATVAVLPEPDEVQVEVKDSDIEWERMRAGGAGGQHVNKTESAVRIWYKQGTPDEIEVKCQDERSQHKNYDRAMRILRSRIYERQQEKLHQERAQQRKNQIGSGDRSDKIRTYNFPQNRVTDHRIGLSLHQLDSIIAGEMGDLIAALKEHDKKQKLGVLKE